MTDNCHVVLYLQRGSFHKVGVACKGEKIFHCKRKIIVKLTNPPYFFILIVQVVVPFKITEIMGRNMHLFNILLNFS